MRVMYTKEVKWLTAGDILAEDIYVDNQLLLKKGTILKFHHIFTLINSNVQSVTVELTPRDSFQRRSISSYLNSPIDETIVLEDSFHELISQYRSIGRYYNFFEKESDIYYLKSLFIKLLSNETVNNLLSALKVWDQYSYYHSVDVFIIGTQFMRELNMTDNLNEVATGFLLHDIGKIKIPRKILQKAGSLTIEEYEVIKTHVYYGEEFLYKLGFTKTVRDMAMYHHAALDGTGYPQHILDVDLATEIKVLTIVDIFSALTLDRPYRKAFTTDSAIEVMLDIKGKFDPNLFEHFLHFMQNEKPKDPVA